MSESHYTPEQSPEAENEPKRELHGEEAMEFIMENGQYTLTREAFEAEGVKSVTLTVEQQEELFINHQLELAILEADWHQTLIKTGEAILLWGTPADRPVTYTIDELGTDGELAAAQQAEQQLRDLYHHLPDLIAKGKLEPFPADTADPHMALIQHITQKLGQDPKNTRQLHQEIAAWHELIASKS